MCKFEYYWSRGWDPWISCVSMAHLSWWTDLKKGWYLIACFAKNHSVLVQILLIERVGPLDLLCLWDIIGVSVTHLNWFDWFKVRLIACFTKNYSVRVQILLIGRVGPWICSVFEAWLVVNDGVEHVGFSSQSRTISFIQNA